MAAPEVGGAAPSLGERLREELVKYLALSAYLYLFFGALALYKAAVLREVGVAFLPLGLAAVKALIVGKFLLLGDVVTGRVHIGLRGLVARVLVRTLLLAVLLAALMLAEEILSGKLHGRTVAAVLGEYRAVWPEHAAMSLLVTLILLPLVTALEIARARGIGLLESFLHEARTSKTSGRAA